MKKIILALAVSLITTAAFAGEAIEGNANSKSNGSTIGQESSASKHNGDVVSGNGGSGGVGDQTTTPGSRADAVHAENVGKPGQIDK